VAALFFRREVATQLSWGGDPRKQVTSSDDVPRLSPRKSFEKWTQDVKGFSAPWEVLDTHQLSALANFLSTRKAEDGARHKEIFFTNMSHEFRTPLTSILGYADILRGICSESSCEKAATEAAETIYRNGEHLLGLINDVLDIAKLGSGGLELHDEPVQLAAIFEDLQALFEAIATKKTIALVFANEGAPDVLAFDILRVKQILINLLGNAIKFTDSGVVKLSATLHPSDRARISFRVCDSGLGIPEEVRPQLFTPFFQGDAKTNRRFGGTGLGLALSHQLAQALGGHLRLVESSKQGTTFEFAVPFREVEAQRAPCSPRSDANTDHVGSPERKGLSSNGLRVLLAEDGEDNQRLISFFLNKAGMQVEIADNGECAVQAVERAEKEARPFHVILMDMQMPVMDGYSATRMLRDRGQQLPIIALTAHAMAGDREKCLAAGCHEYLSKPINRAKLIETVERYATAGHAP
jgi:signal transduction histidine kinase/ActR/RegA family two-component response regulator